MKWFANRLIGKVLSFSVGVMALALIEGHAAGQCIPYKILASDGAAGDQFSESVSISGAAGNEVAIIGSRFDDDNGTASGSAYISRFNGVTWVEEAKLRASDGAANDFFGFSVSIGVTPASEIAIVGAYQDDDNGSNSGSAYIYRKSGATWVQEAKLLASDGAADDLFGISVSISNDVVIVGALRDDDNGMNSGSAYIYRFNGANWVEEQKLTSFDGALNDFFGFSVSISGDIGNEVAIVGVFRDDDNGTDSGSAYIYRFNGENWAEEQKLIAFDGATNDFFGRSVSISGAPGNEVTIVGAYGDGNNGFESGSAYIFRKSGANWVEETKLIASDGAANDQFGLSVSISSAPGNDVAIIGARNDDDIGLNSGSAYIYRFNGATWFEEAKLLASDSAADDLFGSSVSISSNLGNEFAIVGAWSDDDNGPDIGSAYVFTGHISSGFPGNCNINLTGDCNGNGISDLYDLFWFTTSADCNDNGIPDECDIASGLSVDVNGNGIPDECITSCPPDINGDGIANVTDLLSILAAWGSSP